MFSAPEATPLPARPDRPPRQSVLDRLGRPLRELRLSVTDRCNFRCSYCMPAREAYRFMPRAELLSFEELERLVRLLVGRFGLQKLRLTGGEPLLRNRLERLVERLSAIEGLDDLALTTNGFLLDRHAHALAEAGLSRVTVSLDSLRPKVLRQLAGRHVDPTRILQGVAAAARAGLTPIRINSVVQRGLNEDDVVALASHFRGAGHSVRFIELMDVGTLNAWEPGATVPAHEILACLRTLGPLIEQPAFGPSDVARRYRYADGYEVGIIASVSHPFCGGCTRARLTADGRLVLCLFGTGGINLRDSMRQGASDDALEAMVRSAWSARTDRYSELRTHRRMSSSARRRLEMYQVGG